MGRPLARAGGGRGAASRGRALHRRPRAGTACLARSDRPLPARPRPRHARRLGRARGRRRPRRPDRRRRRAAVEAVPRRDRLAGPALRRGGWTRRATSASRSPWSSPATGTSPRTPPSSSRSSTSRSSPSSTSRRQRAIHDRSFHYGDVDDALAKAHLVVRETFRVARFTCLPVECFGVVCDWDEAGGRLTAWANFQGPFTLHGVAAAALGLRGNRLRLLTPPDSGGSFGVKAAVLPYVVLVGLASRALGVPVRWTEDRLEHLAASSASTGRVTTIEAGFTRDGELTALRYDAIEDVGAYVRAPEPATLYRMHGSLSGAYRVRDVAARYRVVLTNTIPSGLNRGFGGPQLYFGLERVMAIAARRLGLDHGGARSAQPRSGRRDALSHAVGRAVRLRRLRGVPRPGARAVGVRGTPCASRERARRGAARRRRARLHRRALDLEHGLHHARADGGRAGGNPAEVGQR